MRNEGIDYPFYSSLPSRERGLKWFCLSNHSANSSVAPFAGAWIEIFIPFVRFSTSCVAPFAGAWIEMAHSTTSMLSHSSLPSRERGLKLWKMIKMPQRH